MSETGRSGLGQHRERGFGRPNQMVYLRASWLGFDPEFATASR